MLEVDVVLAGPRPDRLELARRPHERADHGAVVGAVGVDAVPGGHHVVEAEPVGERPHEVVRRGGGQHDRPAGRAVLLEDRPGERLDHRRQPLGGGLAGGPQGVAGAALGQRRGLPGQHHRRQRLADAVEQAVDEPLAGQAAVGEPGGLHRRRERLAGGAGQQRAVEVEEGSTPGRPASTDGRPKTGEAPLGERGLST